MESLRSPNEQQMEAWQGVNGALIYLAAAYNVNQDALNELAGAYVEQALAQLRQQEAA